MITWLIIDLVLFTYFLLNTCISREKHCVLFEFVALTFFHTDKEEENKVDIKDLRSTFIFILCLSHRFDVNYEVIYVRDHYAL